MSNTFHNSLRMNWKSDFWKKGVRVQENLSSFMFQARPLKSGSLNVLYTAQIYWSIFTADVFTFPRTWKLQCVKVEASKFKRLLEVALNKVETSCLTFLFEMTANFIWWLFQWNEWKFLKLSELLKLDFVQSFLK